MTDNDVIVAEGVVKTYDDSGVPVHAVRGIDYTLGKGEFTKLGEYSITRKKGDMVKDDYQQSKDLEFAQLLPLAQGGIYCVCTDASGGERMSGELRALQTL